jgi:hypothetical protein
MSRWSSATDTATFVGGVVTFSMMLGEAESAGKNVNEAYWQESTTSRAA